MRQIHQAALFLYNKIRNISPLSFVYSMDLSAEVIREERKEMYKRLVLFFVMGLFLLSSCAPATTSSRQAASSGVAQPGVAMPAAPAAAQPELSVQSKALDSANAAAGGAVSGQAAPVAQPLPADKRLVLRNANLTIVLDDPAQALNGISQMAESMGGFVVTSNLYKSTSSQGKEFPEAAITIRVPSDKLNTALDQIHKMVKNPEQDISNENITGQDVTKEYTDLTSREKNLEQAEAQLREIMASATKTEDVLAVYNQLTQIREQIEVLKGQIQYYEESAALSSIAVTLHATASVQPLEIAGWQPVGVARNAVQALINTMQTAASVAIWLALYVLPIALVIFIIARLLWWGYRRTIKNRKTPTSVPPANI